MDEKALKQHIRRYYEQFYKERRAHRLPVPTGRDLALALGYPVSSLPVLSDRQWEQFIPCGNPLPHLILKPGDRILNLGCGAAIDALALLAEYGSTLHIVNLDLIPDVVMRSRQWTAAEEKARSGCLSWVCAEGESLPFQEECFDWVLVNGVFNLFPDKLTALKEIGRVLKPQGFLVGMDLCCAAPLPEYFQEEGDAWAWCMSGACSEDELLKLLKKTGFSPVQIIREEQGDLFHRIAFRGQKKGPVLDSKL